MTSPNAYSSSTTKERQIALALSAAFSLLVGWRPLFQTISLAIRNDEYTHILLILPISLSVIFFELSSSREQGRWGLRLGLPLVGFALLIAVCAHVALSGMPEDVHLAGQMLALVACWIGIFVLCCGVDASRIAAFPLLLLFAMVPLPRMLLNPIIGALQVGSAWSAHALFGAFGVTAIQDGIQIDIPGLTVQVAQQCSSIRSSSMLLVTTIILAQFFLRAFWRKALIAFLAIPLSIAKNGLRIFTIAMLGTRVDPGYLNGRLHHQGGILFFVFALGCVFVAIWICRRAEDRAGAAASARQTLLEPEVNQSLVGVRESDAR